MLILVGSQFFDTCELLIHGMQNDIGPFGFNMFYQSSVVKSFPYIINRVFRIYGETVVFHTYPL